MPGPDDDNSPSIFDYHEAATEIYSSGNIQFDPVRDEDVSASEEGAWVRGWVWVDVEDATDNEFDPDNRKA